MQFYLEYPDVVSIMASQCSLSAIFPIQSALDLALDEAVSQEENESLVFQYLKTLDERKDLQIPDFQTGKSSLQP